MFGTSVDPQQRVESRPANQTPQAVTPSTDRGIDFAQISLDNFSFSSSLLPQAGFPTRSDAQYTFAPGVRFPTTIMDDGTPTVSTSPSQSLPSQTPTAPPVQPPQRTPTELTASPQSPAYSTSTPENNTPRQNAPLPVEEIISGLMRGASFPPGTTFTYPDGRTGVLVGDGQGNAAPAHVTASALARAIGFASPQAFLAAQTQSQPSQPVNPASTTSTVQPLEDPSTGEQPQVVTQPPLAAPQDYRVPQQAPVSTGRILRISPDGSP